MRLINADQIGLTDMEIIMCDGNYKNALEMLIDKIANAPTIEVPQRMRGKWVRTVLGSTNGYGTTVMYQCSECECMSISKYNYCPNCGADMREEQE